MAVALLDITKAVEVARRFHDVNDDPEAIELMQQFRDRKLSIEAEQTKFSILCDRWDNLYYPQFFTRGGASHWADHESANKAGRAHVSLNVYPTYVEVPAALQSVMPVEQMQATGTEASSPAIAAEIERLYFAWKEAVGFELKLHKSAIVKGLYGRTAAKVYWDDDIDQPTFEIIDNPRNLYLGWRDSNYTKLEWAAYCYRITPSTAFEDWGLRVYEGEGEDGRKYPYILPPTLSAFGDYTISQSMVQADLEVEVYDYWYRKPAANAKVRFGKPVKFETWNAIFVGNVMVANKRHPEYKGQMPYIPLFNTFIPGVPDGRPEFYDIEQIIREKDERVSENAQMMSRAVSGQYWQLVGENAPNEVPDGLKPTPNNVVTAGAGNRLEAIEPWMPEFQFENFLTRLDRELVDSSGLNDLLRGMAPNETLSSGKAIQALVANYEMRIMMKRGLLYEFRSAIWALSMLIWGSKNAALKPALEGKAKLVITPPSLTPRDDAEASTIAASMKQAKIWSGKRAMDRMGVEDPETEEDIIRDEQTDATLNPAEVQVMAQLLGILRAQNIQPQPEVQRTVEAQAGALADVRALAPALPQPNQLNDPNAQPVTPAEQLPGNAPGSLAAPQPGSEDLTLQTAIKGGEANSRILQQQKITEQPSGGG